MVTTVIKHDGSTEPFDLEKMQRSVRESAADGGVATEDALALGGKIANAFMEAFAESEQVATDDIREFILEELEVLEPLAASAWRKYDSTRGR